MKVFKILKPGESSRKCPKVILETTERPLRAVIVTRWQLTKGYKDKAAKTLREVARINKKPEPKDLDKRLGM